MNIKTCILLSILLVFSIVLFGCGNDKEPASSEETSPGAAESIDVTTGDAIITDDAIIKDDTDKDTKKDEEGERVFDKSSKDTTSKPQSSKGDKPAAKSDTSKTVPVDDTINCTISIDCLTLFNKDPDLANKVSSKGIILTKKSITLKKNATVYDALKTSGIGFAGKSYISQINGLSEKDGGKLSGWVYYVNGEYATVGGDEYKLKKGDDIRWRYTCNNGNDL